MAEKTLPFLGGDPTFESTATVGGFGMIPCANSFDACFESAKEAVSEATNGTLDYTRNFKSVLENEDLIGTFKDKLLSGITTFCEGAEDLGEYDGKGKCTIAGTPLSNLAAQCSDVFDNTVNTLITEATSVADFLPVKSIDLPLVVKSHIKAASNAIMGTHTINSSEPIIRKQIQRTWVTDRKTGKRWQYPQCMYDKTQYNEIFEGGKGIPFSDAAQKLPMNNVDIIAALTTVAIPSRESITLKIEVTKGYLADGTVVDFPNGPMHVETSTGSWFNGHIQTTVTNVAGAKVVIDETISGRLDAAANQVTLVSSGTNIVSVSFAGRISNQRNERSITWEYSRENKQWAIEDGFRQSMSYTVEQLTDSKAMLNLDLYKMTYNNITDLMFQMEDSKTLDFLDEEFKKYDGKELNPLDFNPSVSHKEFNCDSTVATVALQKDYIDAMLKFTIDRYLIEIADHSKLEDLTFTIYGNPRVISLLDPHVNWVVRNGDMAGGVKLNYNYGIMTSGGFKIQVVSSMKFNIADYQKLRFVAFPTDDLTITFMHVKYDSHIYTNANSAYRDVDMPGGSQTYLGATSRYENISLQGIQGDLSLKNANFISFI